MLIVMMVLGASSLAAQQWEPEYRLWDVDPNLTGRVLIGPQNEALIGLYRMPLAPDQGLHYYDLETLTPASAPAPYTVPGTVITHVRGTSAYGAFTDAPNGICRDLFRPTQNVYDLSTLTGRNTNLSLYDWLTELNGDGQPDLVYITDNTRTNGPVSPDRCFLDLYWGDADSPFTQRSVFRVQDSAIDNITPVRVYNGMGHTSAAPYMVTRTADALVLKKFDREDLEQRKDTIAVQEVRRQAVDDPRAFWNPVVSETFTMLMNGEQTQATIFTPDSAWLSDLDDLRDMGLVPGMLGQRWTIDDYSGVIRYREMLAMDLVYTATRDSMSIDVTLYMPNGQTWPKPSLSPAATIHLPWVNRDSGESVQLTYAELFQRYPEGYGVVIGYRLKVKGDPMRDVLEYYRTSSIPTTVAETRVPLAVAVPVTGGWLLTGQTLPMATVVPVYSTLGQIVGYSLATPTQNGVFLEADRLPGHGPLFAVVGVNGYRLR